VTDELLDGLNPPQRQAASIRDGAVLVLAGAGSGKTRLLTHRIAWLVEQGVPPWQILAVTFTNKAAGEMKERVSRMVAARGHGDAARELTVSTFHSMCARFLRRDIEPLGWTRSFTIYDADDQKRLVNGIMKDMGIAREVKPAMVRRAIDQAKNKMWSPTDLERQIDHALGDPTVEVYRRYEAALKTANALDFNDLVNHMVRLWRDHPAVVERYRRRYRYLLVDEYQDTNQAQYQLVRLLASPQTGGHGNVMVVGDDDQSIYAFRGADIRNILDFEKDFPGCQTIRLEQNYRSTGHILDAANAVVANNRGRMDKSLWTDAGLGEQVRTINAADEGDEARAVVSLLQAQRRDGRRWGDMAIIYRTNAASRSFEQALLQARVPHILVGSRKFYERREVRDMVAYLKLLLNPADEMAFLRVVNVPRRGVGLKSVATIRDQARAAGVSSYDSARRWSEGRGKARAAVSAFLDLLDRIRADLSGHAPGTVVEMLLRESGYAEMLQAEDNGPDRLNNVLELARAIEEDQDQTEGADPVDPLVRLQDFLDRASLSAQADELPDDNAEGFVTLLTAHLCKGLEFPLVIVAGMHEGGFPHWNARESEHEIEEERRLVYVAMTRAQRMLALSRPRRRLRPGVGFEDVAASRFLREIPREHMHRSAAGTARRTAGGMSSERARQLGFAGVKGGGRATAMGRRTTRRRSLPDVTSALKTPSAPSTPQGHHRSVAIEDPGQLVKGARVLHPSLGAGTIRRADGAGSNLKLTIHFDSHGRKVIYARFVELELLE
jgi:DNA helicase-2/ATP-dependent DNA helicase PcrA